MPGIGVPRTSYFTSHIIKRQRRILQCYVNRRIVLCVINRVSKSPVLRPVPNDPGTESRSVPTLVPQRSDVGIGYRVDPFLDETSNERHNYLKWRDTVLTPGTEERPTTDLRWESRISGESRGTVHRKGCTGKLRSLGRFLSIIHHSDNLSLSTYITLQ